MVTVTRKPTAKKQRLPLPGYGPGVFAVRDLSAKRLIGLQVDGPGYGVCTTALVSPEGPTTVNAALNGGDFVPSLEVTPASEAEFDDTPHHPYRCDGALAQLSEVLLLEVDTLPLQAEVLKWSDVAQAKPTLAKPTAATPLVVSDAGEVEEAVAEGAEDRPGIIQTRTPIDRLPRFYFEKRASVNLLPGRQLKLAAWLAGVYPPKARMSETHGEEIVDEQYHLLRGALMVTGAPQARPSSAAEPAAAGGETQSLFGFLAGVVKGTEAPLPQDTAAPFARIKTWFDDPAALFPVARSGGDDLMLQSLAETFWPNGASQLASARISYLYNLGGGRYWLRWDAEGDVEGAGRSLTVGIIAIDQGGAAFLGGNQRIRMY